MEKVNTEEIFHSCFFKIHGYHLHFLSEFRLYNYTLEFKKDKI
nr:MAG TPA: Alpha-acetolactate decarboxylase [Caudoviricetes sp.]